MKRMLIILGLMAGLVACASNPQSTNEAATAQEETTERKKVCKYERGGATGARMVRVCRYVEAP